MRRATRDTAHERESAGWAPGLMTHHRLRSSREENAVGELLRQGLVSWLAVSRAGVDEVGVVGLDVDELPVVTAFAERETNQPSVLVAPNS